MGFGGRGGHESLIKQSVARDHKPDINIWIFLIFIWL